MDYIRPIVITMFIRLYEECSTILLDLLTSMVIVHSGDKSRDVPCDCHLTCVEYGTVLLIAVHIDLLIISCSVAVITASSGVVVL